MRGAVLALLLIASTWPYDGLSRDLRQRYAFRKDNPCPVTGKTRGACPGYVVDHIQPLCAGGADHPSNMQWLTVEAARAKDRPLLRECRARKKLLLPRSDRLG